MITQFSCTCGNTDPAKAAEYDGALGYEAIVCTVCCRYYDHTGEQQPDDWSRQYYRETAAESLELFGEQQAAGDAGRRASHPNPWDSAAGRWTCDCQQCEKTRKAWPETTRIWSPRS